MFEKGTVFVVGAGASKELDLPLGIELMETIASIIAYDSASRQFAHGRFHEAMVELAKHKAGINFGNALNHLRHVARKLQDALPFALSIDNLLDAHRDDSDMVAVGKIGIALAILSAEHDSNLNDFIRKTTGSGIVFGNDKFNDFKKSWYLPLMRLLNAGLPLASLSDIFQNVSFITFNYDRCLEHFLIAGIMRYYAVDESTAIDALQHLRVVHVYGKVGRLSWHQDNNYHADFGDAGTRNLVHIALRLQTFTESANSGLVAEAREMIERAETLVFLGFGYLPQNIQVLSVPTTDARRVFITTMGISDDEVAIVEDEMENMLSKSIGGPDDAAFGAGHAFELFIERGSCADLMRNHWLRLTR